MEQAAILNSFFSFVFTKEEATDYELPPPGVDRISSRVLVELADEIAVPLAAIFQKSLETDKVPRSWKVADVVPIFKKGMKSVPGNYRPVSLTSHIGKLMEKVIKEEIMSHLNRHDLLNDTQHGFMRGRSCLTNLLTYLEGVARMLDEGKNVDIIYLDFAKAFNKVPHRRLISKKVSMGVEGRVKGWIQKWLEGRKQTMVINGISVESLMTDHHAITCKMVCTKPRPLRKNIVNMPLSTRTCLPTTLKCYYHPSSSLRLYNIHNMQYMFTI